MPKPELPAGLAPLSSIYTIRGEAVEAAAVTYTETAIETGIDAINREVLVWWELDFSLTIPDIGALPPLNTLGIRRTTGQITDRTQTVAVNIDNNALIARSITELLYAVDVAAISTALVTSARSPVQGYQQTRGIPLAITSNDQVFLGVLGTLTLLAQTARMRAWVQRAKVTDVGLYAARIEQRLP